MTEPKEKPTCPYCGSEDVNCDANAAWNADTQEWEAVSTYNNGYCNGCDSETNHFNWIPHEDTQQKD